MGARVAPDSERNKPLIAAIATYCASWTGVSRRLEAGYAALVECEERMCQRTGRSGDAPVPPAGWACTSSAPDGGHLGSGCGGTRPEAAERSKGRERPGGGGRHCATRTWPGAETVSESRPAAGVSDLVLTLDHRSLPRRASLAAAVLQWTDSANRPAVPPAVSRRPIYSGA